MALAEQPKTQICRRFEADGEGRVGITAPMIFSCDETCDVGKDTGSGVSPDYGVKGNEFNGEVNWVQIDLERTIAII